MENSKNKQGISLCLFWFLIILSCLIVGLIVYFLYYTKDNSNIEILVKSSPLLTGVLIGIPGFYLAYKRQQAQDIQNKNNSIQLDNDRFIRLQAEHNEAIKLITNQENNIIKQISGINKLYKLLTIWATLKENNDYKKEETNENYKEILKIFNGLLRKKIQKDFRDEIFYLIRNNSNPNIKWNLDNTDLKLAFLKSANLQHANLQCADFTDAYLEKANLQYANLQGAYLKEDNLEDRNLNLTDTDFTGARYCKHTEFPNGFSPEKKLMIKTDCND